MKSPAILFYTSDFLTGTLHMEDHMVGQYIKLLCLQHQSGGYLTPQQMDKISHMEPLVVEKFTYDKENDRYYNERMLAEIEKRNAFKESRLNNLKSIKSKTKKQSDPHMESLVGSHMENENINSNIKGKGESEGKRETVADKSNRYTKLAIDHLQEKKSPLYGVTKVQMALKDFIDYRLTAWPNKPFSEKAVKLMAGTLIKHSRQRSEAAVLILERSVEMGWLGLFALPEPQMMGIMGTNTHQRSQYTTNEGKS